MRPDFSPGVGRASHGRDITIVCEVGVDVLVEHLGAIDRRGGDASPWLKRVWVPWVRWMFKEQLKTQGEHMGVGAMWALPYSDRYKKWKKENSSNSNRKEWLTGAMFGELRSGTHVAVSPLIGVVSTTVLSDRGFPYSGVQQGSYPDSRRGTPTRLGTGSSTARKKRPSEKGMKRKIPARPPWGHVKMTERNKLETSIINYVLTGAIQKVV